MIGGVQIGLSNLVYALLTNDPAGGTAAYGAPVAIPGVTSANLNPNQKSSTFFGDNGPMEVAATLGEIQLDISAGNIPLSVQAVLLGHTYVNGIIVRKGSDVAPWVAVGFKTMKSNGNFRYVWLMKGKFSEPEQKAETKGDSINFQPTSISAYFVKRDADDIWQLQSDQDDTGYLAATGTTWFNAVATAGVAEAVAPTVSSVVPANAATGIAIGSTIVLTFSEALNPSFVIKENFILQKTAGGIAVPFTIALSGGNTIVTLTPTGNMTASTAHQVIVTTDVRDANGNELAVPYVSTFTTA